MSATEILFFCAGGVLGMLCMAFIFALFGIEDEIDPHADEFTEGD